MLQHEHPIAFVSKALSPRNLGLSTYEKEYLAILLAIEQWHPYLQYGEFIIRTDHRSLSHLSDQRLHTTWQQKVFTKLLGLQYKVVYKKGTENCVADALSRRPHPELSAISSATPAWLSDVYSSYANDPRAQDPLIALSVKPDSVPHFPCSKGYCVTKIRSMLGQLPPFIRRLCQLSMTRLLGPQWYTSNSSPYPTIILLAWYEIQCCFFCQNLYHLSTSQTRPLSLPRSIIAP